ncbi:response regulator transcription factor [Methylobacterium nonmethylotrophicum]
MPTIAIVDDDEAVRVATASLVRSLGYAARPYASAEDFLADLARDPVAAPPDCLITDVQMPGITGLQLQDQLQAEGRTFPIIITTAFHSEVLRQRAVASGAAAFLEKPFNGDVISEVLESVLARIGRS